MQEGQKKIRLLGQLFTTFLSISPVTFGGGYGMIPLLEKVIVKQNKWMEPEEMVDVLAVAQTVPGSVAVNAATFIGFQVAGIAGAVAATIGVIAPAFLIVITLAAFFLGVQQHPVIQAAFLGIRPAIVALILFAAIKTSKTAIVDKPTIVIAVLAFLALLFLPLSPIAVLLVGGASGIGIGLAKKSKRTQKNASLHD